MFDRDDIVDIIRDHCIDTDQGAGAVVLSAQKSGKSHLLGYLYRQRDEDKKAFFCWISVNSLKAKVLPGQKLDDEVFLRFFLKLLHDELCSHLAREQRSRDERTQQVTSDRLRLQANDPADADVLPFLQTRLLSNAPYLAELDALEKSKNEITALLAKGNTATSPDLYEFVDDLFPKLKRLNKRVVIFIDDVHDIVQNHDFSPTLLSLLRAANSDGNLVPVLSSAVQLMHPTLHQRERGDQTRSLFNDLRVEPLACFSDDEALRFLTWPQAPNPPLTDEEKAYILELSGASPHFLKEVRSRFLRNRPATSEDRKTFERNLSSSFEGTFEDIWQRSTPEQRTAARNYSGDASAATAQDWGALGCFLRGPAKPFARLFGGFVSGKKAEVEREVVVEVAQALKVFQTALCVADPKVQHAIITFILTNKTTRQIDVRVEAEMEQFSLISRTLLTLPPSKKLQHEARVAIQRRATKDLTNPEDTQIRYKVEQVMPSGQVVIGENTPFVKVLAVDQFTFARRDHVQSTLLNFSWLIAAWVDAEAPGIAPIVTEVAKAVRALGMAATGYPTVGGPAAEAEVIAQISEIYAALRGRNIVYHSRTIAPFQDVNDFSQRVRLPSVSLANGCANCLDGAVLFASLLRAFDLDPVILFLPDHALVGWKMSRSAGAEPRFLEITELADKDFDGACQTGAAIWARVKGLVAQQTPDVIQDMSNFAILVDIREVEQQHPGKLKV
jgi:hypothetical protein